ncbi:hypothetical protein K6119_16420 [Paracrocinitomix mangrovi]|uniref:hypothetical protein n=1 Tax=Paracrocinitomix mangrovi TaxID=2862509 RepID=UPI001C8D073C|nr:hypothetical protein [Paracrocinitomix mangrovi]UKN01314.1 hypothetical protein K6119_16420 [Paracrocinitomix mangrovi]
MKWLLYILLVLPSFSMGQKASMLFRQPELKIGEQTTFVLSMEFQDPEQKARIAWPQFDENLTEYIEILDRTVDHTKIVDSAKGIYVHQQEFTVTCFDAGIHKLKPLPVELNDSTYLTNPTELIVHTVEVDTTQTIKDIKGNYGVDYSFGEKLEDWFRKNWHWFVIVAGFIALFFIVRLMQRNKSEEKVAPPPPPIPAHITALKSLIEMKKREAWKTENKKEYYSELTYTIRRYLEQRFKIQAIEHTTREIINDLRYADISEEDKVYLRKILSEADMVKFAKMKPDSQHGEDSLEKSIDFVNKTKLEEETEEPKEENES